MAARSVQPLGSLRTSAKPLPPPVPAGAAAVCGSFPHLPQLRLPQVWSKLAIFACCRPSVRRSGYLQLLLRWAASPVPLALSEPSVLLPSPIPNRATPAPYTCTVHLLSVACLRVLPALPACQRLPRSVQISSTLPVQHPSPLRLSLILFADLPIQGRLPILSFHRARFHCQIVNTFIRAAVAPLKHRSPEFATGAPPRFPA